MAVLCLLPTIWQPLPSWLGFLKGNKVSLGLDLQGGTHLVLTVDIDQAVVNSLEVNADELRRELRKAGIKSAKIDRLDQTTLVVTRAERPTRQVGRDRRAVVSQPQARYRRDHPRRHRWCSA